MCGDGTNDVGGLKAAHIGVALLAPSQIAKQQEQAKKAGKQSGTSKDLAATGKY